MDTNTKSKLNELSATAICGNDITSSCLYVVALSVFYAGQWAWVSLLIVSVVLYFFRSIYGEVIGALPLNGGAYNALLNTTSKFVASLAACFTLLSYMATAVISANEAMHYLHILWNGLPVLQATIGLLAFFMLLTIMGIKESSKVATAIFLLHLATLGLLVVFAVLFLMEHGFDLFFMNFSQPQEGSLPLALFFGFSAAMLGISGFESSANFVEEQKSGVFPKTLRNMWAAVTIINPLMAFMALSLVSLAEIHGNQEALLSYLGQIAGGGWLALLISVDAALVLSGAVLTSFIGVTGLVHRMVLDRCLPQFLLKPNKFGTQYRIVIAFFILDVSILAATQGKLTTLAGVYTISFLSVMVLFGIGNLLLKIRRSGLKRPVSAPWLGVFFAVSAVLAALIGNVFINPMYLVVFFQYFLPTVLIVFLMLNRVMVLSACLFFIQALSKKIAAATKTLSSSLENKIEDINSQQIVFFTRGGDLSNLNLALIYVRNNEHTNRMKIVTVVHDEAQIPVHIEEDVRFLDRAYPEIDIEFIVQYGSFGPALIQELSEKWNIPTNFMFIGSPNGAFAYDLADLGGVRLII